MTIEQHETQDERHVLYVSDLELWTIQTAVDFLLANSCRPTKKIEIAKLYEVANEIGDELSLYTTKLPNP